MTQHTHDLNSPSPLLRPTPFPQVQAGLFAPAQGLSIPSLKTSADPVLTIAGAPILSAGLQAETVRPEDVTAYPPVIPGYELTSSHRGLRVKLPPSQSCPKA